MAKVGILTFQNTLNYGAALQCHALYRQIQKLGHEPIVIDYRCKQIARNEGLVCSLQKPRSVLRYLKRQRRVRSFSQFRKQLKFTSPCTRDNIAEVCKDLDFVVVGSDQVWNPRCMGNDPTYFLDFIEDSAKKKSYAASIGSTAMPRTTIDTTDLLNRFSSLLLREKTGAEYVSSIVTSGVEPKAVLDPTLLMREAEWSDLSAEPKGALPEGFVLFYVINEKERSVEAALKLASEGDLGLVELASGEMEPLPGMESAVFLKEETPEGFLWLFSHAGPVVVSSFHGVCFSIIFHRDFYYSLGSAGALGDNSQRIVDLLSALGLERRSVQDYLDGTAEMIDYDEVDRRLEEMRISSVRELSESLQGMKSESFGGVR